MRLPIALALLLSSACSDSSSAPTSWQPLVNGLRTASDQPLAAHLRAEPDGSALWVEHAIASDAWRPEDRDGLWSAERPDGIGFMKSGEALELGEYANAPDVDNPADLAHLVPGTFASVGARLYLSLPPSEQPAPLSFAVRKPRGAPARPQLGGWTGDGFGLWPGESVAFEVDARAHRTLRFHWATEGLSAPSAPARAELRVRLDGAELARLTRETHGGDWHAIELPGGGARAASLAFELAGEPCLALVLDPGLASPPETPPESTPPDLVLFLADTLRADSLEYAGGPPGLAPELGRLARASLRFTQARSPSTWTLPAQASMLTGLYPEQHGATALGHGLSGELATLPELLQRHGYRTGAVTDSAFVSRNYGFDQGFAWFQEFRTWDLGTTLRAARAFLEADDGRPAFLFVQTYRTHMPYRTGVDEESAALARLLSELRAGCAAYGGDGSIPVEEAGARLLALYREGVKALDAELGEWWRAVEARATRPTFLVFTSDHGEAFLEHREMGHGGSPWDEKLRIPLLLHGPGIAPGEVTHGASLVDVPATLLALAGAPVPAGWEGRDLRYLPVERPTYSFVRIGADPMVAIVDGARKVYAAADPARLAAGEVRGATDLDTDPRELGNAAEGEAWPAELARRHAPAMERLVRSLAEPSRVELSPEDRALMDAIGYGGTD